MQIFQFEKRNVPIKNFELNKILFIVRIIIIELFIVLNKILFVVLDPYSQSNVKIPLIIASF